MLVLISLHAVRLKPGPTWIPYDVILSNYRTRNSGDSKRSVGNGFKPLELNIDRPHDQFARWKHQTRILSSILRISNLLLLPITRLSFSTNNNSIFEPFSFFLLNGDISVDETLFNNSQVRRKLHRVETLSITTCNERSNSTFANDLRNRLEGSSDLDSSIDSLII